mgnify:CR=1 FL=1
MIDFLNLSENKSNCECLKLGYSMQLLPYQYDPYVLYIGEQGDYIYIDEINIIDSYGNKHNVTTISGDQEHENYISLTNIQFNDNNKVVLQLVLRNQIDNVKVLYSDPLLISSNAINKLNDALILPFVYFNYKRVTLFESIEIPDMQADERFGETIINVSEYKGIGNNDITPIFNLVSENNDNIITENNDNIILE